MVEAVPESPPKPAGRNAYVVAGVLSAAWVPARCLLQLPRARLPAVGHRWPAAPETHGAAPSPLKTCSLLRGCSPLAGAVGEAGAASGGCPVLTPAPPRFYGALLGSICVLYLLPLCWVLALLNSSLFLGSAEFYQVVLEFKATVEQQLGIRPIESPSPSQPAEIEAGAGAAAPLPDRTPTPTSAEDLTPGSVEEAEEAEPDEEFKDAIEENQLLGLEDDESSQCSVEFDLPDNGFLSKNEVIRSKVSRLTERLRKRCPSNNFGSCTGCAATFSVLKKRRSCSNCGNSFCSRCCSYKVLKSSMGATAPEAQRETVFVCAPCSLALAK
ncbi:protrudin [Alligator sinensis]|uniref:Protrudin n=1 Tax=Alligator sinensis TaxID=38654 RepID=A0A1U8DG66_ALLSI|nr:protrudin [Alligator sinensis]